MLPHTLSGSNSWRSHAHARPYWPPPCCLSPCRLVKTTILHSRCHHLTVQAVKTEVWPSISSGTSNFLWSLGRAATDVWTAGISRSITHYNGTASAAVASRAPRSISTVFGSSASDMLGRRTWRDDPPSQRHSLVGYHQRDYSGLGPGVATPRRATCGPSTLRFLHYNGTARSQ